MICVISDVVDGKRRDEQGYEGTCCHEKCRGQRGHVTGFVELASLPHDGYENSGSANHAPKKGDGSS
jgi:hypothetical protein